MFRREALERHLNGREDTVLPRLVRPSVFRLLWAGLALLAALVAVGAAARLPEYASGTGVVVAGREGTELVVLLPYESLSRLRPGLPAVLVGDDGRRPERRVLARVEPRPLSPDAIRQRFGATAAGRVTGPVAVAVLPFTPAPGAPAAAAHAGSVYQVEVEVGWTRIAALVSKARKS